MKTNKNTAARVDQKGIRLGEILVQQGMLTKQQVGEVLEAQSRQGRPFGVLAEQMFGLDPKAVESAWVMQYAALAGTVDIETIEIDDQCVGLVNRRQAWQFHVAPVRREEGELIIVTTAKHLARALRFAASTFREPTFFQLAESDALESLLMELYPVPTYLAAYATSR